MLGGGGFGGKRFGDVAEKELATDWTGLGVGGVGIVREVLEEVVDIDGQHIVPGAVDAAEIE
jgi:hypothetical protein